MPVIPAGSAVVIGANAAVQKTMTFQACFFFVALFSFSLCLFQPNKPKQTTHTHTHTHTYIHRSLHLALTSVSPLTPAALAPTYLLASRLCTGLCAGQGQPGDLGHDGRGRQGADHGARLPEARTGSCHGRARAAAGWSHTLTGSLRRRLCHTQHAHTHGMRVTSATSHRPV